MFISDYKEDGLVFPKRSFLTDEEFNRACLVFPRVCVDVFFYGNKVLFLAHRIIPIKKWMGFGGAINPGESIKEAAKRVVKNDTGLDISLEGLVYLGLFRYRYAADSEPRDAFGFTFGYKFQVDELEDIKLNPTEYNTKEATKMFTESDILIEEKDIHPGVKEAFYRIFSKLKTAE